MIPKLEELKRLLWEEWDPIGVNDDPHAFGEYDGYALEIWKKLNRAATVDEIEAYLDWAVIENMALTASCEGRNRPIAEKAVAIGVR